MNGNRFGWTGSELRLVQPVSKGDYVGHPFRGNQWTDGSGVTSQPMSSASNDVSNQIDGLIKENNAALNLHHQFNGLSDRWSGVLQQIKDLGFEVKSRSDVVIDGKVVDIIYDADELRTQYPNHPVTNLIDQYHKANRQLKNTYFEAHDTLVFGSFDLTEGVSVQDHAKQMLADKIAQGIRYDMGADNVRLTIELDARSEADKKAILRFVYDEGCTGPTGIGKGATGVNNAIRQGKNTAFAKQIDKTMLISNRPIAVYRGASLPKVLLDQLTVGSTYTEHGFMSTSPQRHTAEFYAGARHDDKLGGRDARITIFRMLLPKGTKANPMAVDEIVLARNSTIRVASKQDITDPKLGPITLIDAVVEQ